MNTYLADKVYGELVPVQIDSHELWFKVTARHFNGKCHRAYARTNGNIVRMACSCPGSQNGRLSKQCSIVANGWELSNCQN